MWFTRKTLPPNLKNSVAPGKQTIFILLPWSVQKEAWSPHLLTSLAFSRARRHRVSAAQRHYWGPDFSLAALVLSSRAATSPCSKAAAVTSSWTAAVPELSLSCSSHLFASCSSLLFSWLHRLTCQSPSHWTPVPPICPDVWSTLLHHGFHPSLPGSCPVRFTRSFSPSWPARSCPLRGVCCYNPVSR